MHYPKFPQVNNDSDEQLIKEGKSLTLYAETTLPTEFGLFRTLVFREAESEKEHLAIIAGDIKNQKDVLMRIHSECFTGEVLHSLKCDCREQLHTALKQIAEKGCGLLIYLRQEGRGIGLGNKIRAYALQEQGHDTVDANRLLGFEDDLRTYGAAEEILRYFNINSVQILTNNPLKIKGIEDIGIKVTRRVPLLCHPNSHNLHYIQTKQERMGHLFDPEKLPLLDAEEPDK